MNLILANCVLILGLFCTLGKPGYKGPVDLVVILDEGKSCVDYFLEIKWDLQKTYRHMMELVANAFDVGWDKTRVAVICTGSAENPASVVVKFSDKKTAANLVETQTWCTVGTDYPNNMDLVFMKAEELLHGQDSRNLAKIVLVLMEGHLWGNETNMRNKPRPVIKDAKVFSFLFFNEQHEWVTHLGRTILVNTDQDFKKAIRIFPDIICERYWRDWTWDECKAVPEDKSMKCQIVIGGCGECSEENCDCEEMYPWEKECKAKPNDATAKCQRDLIGNSKCEKNCDEIYCNCDDMYPWEKECFLKPNDATAKCQRNLITNSKCEKSCDERYCNCDYMYPWGSCSVTCGNGIKRRNVLPESSCEIEIEMDCHVDPPCLTNITRISGPLDIVLILDESKSFHDWHVAKKKILNGTYRKMMSWVVNNFEIGLDKTRVAVLCDSRTVFRFEESMKSDDEIRNQDCSANGSLVDKMDESFNTAIDILVNNGPGNRKTVEKAILVFTDGYLKPLVELYNYQKGAEFVQNGGNVFFFHLMEMNDPNLSKKSMVDLAKNEKNVIFFNVLQPHNMFIPLHETFCGSRRFSKETCKAVPNNENMKCQLKDTSMMMGGCYGKDEAMRCDESYCECDEMYPWPPECPAPCAGMRNRQVPVGSICPAVTGCFGPCPTVPFDRLKRVYK